MLLQKFRVHGQKQQQSNIHLADVNIGYFYGLVGLEGKVTCRSLGKGTVSRRESGLSDSRDVE